jgi:hypothetical protein
MFGSFIEGQHVVARKELHAGLFGYPVRKGTRGVILQRAVGIFSDKYVVSFPSGRATVSGRHLKPTFFAPGNDVAAGVRLGWWLFLLIPLIPAIGYLLAGGSVVGLIRAAPGAIIDAVVSLASRAIGIFGLSAFLIMVACAWLLHRRGTRG